MGTTGPLSAQGISLARERVLYRALLQAGLGDDVEPLLKIALATLLELCNAQKGYLELSDESRHGSMSWSAEHGCAEGEALEFADLVSRGIIGAAIAEGRSITTASAAIDSRFRDRGSVQRNGIQAVLCAPIRPEAPVGVLYLQGRNSPGPFEASDLELAETVAGYIGVFAERILSRRRSRLQDDFVSEAREKLNASGIIGRSRALGDLLKQVALVAPLDVRVLLTGDSGTGKSQIARVIHNGGNRSAGPFIELNCAALPDSLFESELFGAVAGAHSTANRRIHGKLDAARNGTLFLDEVGELSLAAQAKLLQVLQSGEFFPLGANEPQRTNARIVAATNRNLRDAVREKTFREDLLYRLEVIPLRVPGLAEREEDISELCEHFCRTACKTHGFGDLAMSLGALSAARLASWPGNIRQLGNAVEAAVIRAASEGVPQVERRHLFSSDLRGDEPKARTLQSATRSFQKKLLTEALERNDWNVGATAVELDLARSHVYALIRTLGVRSSEPSAVEKG